MPTIHRGSSMTPKLRGGSPPKVTRGRRAFSSAVKVEREEHWSVEKDSASISSDKTGENPVRRKTKDS